MASCSVTMKMASVCQHGVGPPGEDGSFANTGWPVPASCEDCLSADSGGGGLVSFFQVLCTK